MNIIAKGLSQLRFACKTKAPYLQFAMGMAGFVATIYSVWKAKPEVDHVLEEYEENKAKIEEARKKIDAGEIPAERYPQNTQTKDLWKYRFYAGVGVAKALTKPLFIAAGTCGYIGAAFVNMHNWYQGAATLWMGAERERRSLEAAVAAKYGAEALNELRGGKSKTIIDMDENGNTTVEDILALPERSRVNSVFFGQDYTDAAEGTPEGNRTFLDLQQAMWTNTLDARRTRTSPGYVFLNEVREALGYPWTAEGWLVGWTKYHDDEDNKKYGCAGCVDFGYRAAKDPATKRFLQGVEEVVELTFNIDPTPIIDRCGLTRKYETRLYNPRRERRHSA